MFDSQEELHIAGVVIRCSPLRFDGVLADLHRHPEVDVHRIAERDGLIIATVETSRLDTQVAATKALLDIAGVVDVDLVYHAFDHTETMPEEVAS